MKNLCNFRLPFRHVAVFVALAGGLLAGCAGYTASDKVPVQGHVTWDGTPVENGAIAFVPTSGDRTIEAVSTNIKGGQYSFERDRGPIPGEYRIEITWAKKTGKTVPIKNEPPSVMDELVQVIPERFNTRSELKRTVEAKANVIDFELKGNDARASP